MSIGLELVYADGTVESHVCPSADLTIGRSAEATLCVSRVPELAPLQLLLMARRDGVWVSDARGAQVMATRDGRPVGNSLVPWGSEIDVGSLTVRIRKPIVAAQGRSRSALLIVGVGVLAVVGLVLARNRGGAELPSTNTKPPPLFDDLGGLCPESPQSPATRALEISRKADAKESRYPFAANDGVEAVALYRVAAACYEQAGLLAQGQAMSARGTELARRVDHEYRSTILQQRRALRSRDLPTVLTTTQLLRALLTERADAPYAKWLAVLERHVSAKVPRHDKLTSKPRKL